MSLENDITTIKTLVEAGEPIFKAASSDQIANRNANKRKFYWLSYDNYSGEFHLTMIKADTLEDAQDEVGGNVGIHDSTDIVCDEYEIKQLKKLINSSGIHESKINEKVVIAGKDFDLGETL